ncbi:dihydrolipoyl dehydrogenase [Parasphaerochaeta coccoides]|uniref:Dihydrolipoyl dehydrogenase n=1 Tax=Parasphaerochaeta coccoides (strain ATCC BAA-1237 / DSM 17374 / SPN1) TaxID=760011 RepID=F4GKG7_PARC1|nr:dihydrolipoyl dehydrogenase [Parasphaerochaeta coccoides]AEC02850.1 dihydrolipoamide dehydrogenase [Parasphaerochaeta coccoides DSM 17374]
MTRYDLIVVGAGPGGYIAAERAGALGKKVLLIEKDHMGGVCTNKGCIPTKSLLNSAKHYLHAKESARFGVHAEGVSFDIREAHAWKTETIETLRSGISFLMKNNKVDVVAGTAQFIDPHHVKVGETEYEGDYLILAMGSSPVVPPIAGATLPHVLTSDGILEMKTLPKKLVIVGGGVIGIEFASFYSMVGVDVTVIEMMPEILPMMDAEFATLMRREMKGVSFNLGCKVIGITEKDVRFTTAKGDEKSVEADTVLLSIGRRANIAGIEPLHLETDRQGIVVDERMKTNIPTIYAIGDVNGRSQLAHSASRMAEVAVSNIFGTTHQRMRYQAVPWAVYGNPEAAGCGLTEQAAAAEGRKILTATTQMRANGRFLAEQGKRAGGLVKVIADAQTHAILGVHMLGTYSSEIIWGASALIEAELRIKDVKELIFPHPSVAELIRDTVFAIDHTL